MAGVQNGHIVLARHGIDGGKERTKVFVRVNVLLPMRGQKDVLPLLQPQPGVNVRLLNSRKVPMEHLCHRRAGDIHPLLGQAALVQILPGVFRVGKVHIGDNIHNPAVGFLRQALILAAVARLHVENGNVEPLGRDSRQAGVCIAQDQHGIRADGGHQLIGAVDDIADGGAQIVPHGVHVNLRVLQSQIMEEDAIEGIVVILSGVGQNAVKIGAALFDHRRQPDDLRPGSHNDQQLQPAVVAEGEVRIVKLHIHGQTTSKNVSGFAGSKHSLAHITVTRFSVSDRLMMLWV